MKFLSILVLTAVCFVAEAQQDFSNVEVKAIHVSKNIYMLQGVGGNIGVYAWSDEDGNLTAVLGIPPATDPQNAVKIAIVASAKRGTA